MEHIKFISNFKKFLTTLVPVKLNAGYRLTVDDTVYVDKETANKPLDFNSKLSKKYVVNSESGSFELDSQKRGKNGETLYVLTHGQTGVKFTLSKNMFEILFRSEK